MYRRILVPIDATETAKLGLEHAYGLAKDQKAKVRVLNVVDDITASPPMEPYAAGEVAKIVDASRREGRKVLEAAAALAASLRIDAETVQIEGRGDDVSDVILREARKRRCDLIVMGTHGRRGFSRALLGSNAEQVLRETSLPVLLVRAPSRPEKSSRRPKRAYLENR